MLQSSCTELTLFLWKQDKQTNRKWRQYDAVSEKDSMFILDSHKNCSLRFSASSRLAQLTWKHVALVRWQKNMFCRSAQHMWCRKKQIWPAPTSVQEKIYGDVHQLQLVTDYFRTVQVDIWEWSKKFSENCRKLKSNLNQKEKSTKIHWHVTRGRKLDNQSWGYIS